MTLMKGKQPPLLLRRIVICTNAIRYETISDLMQLQDQIESFQKLVFSHFRSSVNNDCRISSLVPLVKESWGIYRFITSMLRAMYRSPSYHPSSLLFLLIVFLVRPQEPTISKRSNPFINAIMLSTIAYASSTMNVLI
jgi:ANTH domain